MTVEDDAPTAFGLDFHGFLVVFTFGEEDLYRAGDDVSEMPVRLIAQKNNDLVFTIAVIGADAHQREVPDFPALFSLCEVFQNGAPALVCLTELIESGS